MSWIHHLWPMATGAFLTMALVYLWTGLRKPRERVNVLFASSAIFAAIYSWCELSMTTAGSPAEFLSRLRVLDLAAAGVAVSLVAFVWDYFGTGRKWLGRIAIGVMLCSVIPDLLPVPKLVFIEITGIRKVSTFGGATYTVAEGVSSPWNLLFYGGVLLLLVFVADTSIRMWRRGGRRKALAVGGTVVLFYLIGGAQAFLTDLGVLRTPYLVSFCWMAILVVMAKELSNDQRLASQLAKKLRENQERMKLATSAANLGLWEWDIVRDDIWINAVSRERVGAAESERVTLDRFLGKVHPGDREAFRQALRRAIDHGGDFEFEYRLSPPHDRERWLAVIGKVECDAKHRPLLMRGITLDITERKRNEEALQRSEQLARTLLNTTSSMTHLLDAEGMIIDLNDSMAKGLGGTREELIGTNVFDRFSPKSAERRREQLRRVVLEQKLMRFEDEDSEGNKIFDTIIFPVAALQGEKQHFVVFAHDITDIKKMEVAHREGMERYKAIVESFDGFIYICSQDNRIEFMNRRLIDRTGRNAVGELCYEVLHERDSTCVTCPP